MDIREEVRRLVRYGLTGGTGLLLNVGLLVVLVRLAGVDQLLGAVMATLLTLLVTFTLTERWVFRTYQSATLRSAAGRAPAYYAVMLASKGANLGIYAVLIDRGVWYPVAWILGSVLVFVFTFSLNRFIWRTTSPQQRN